VRDIVSINLWSQWEILSVSTFDLSEWYCQYQPLISVRDIVSINLWSQWVILSVSISHWDQRLILTISHSDQRLILTISLTQIKGWYWQYLSLRSKVNTDNISQRSKVDTDNITHWDQRLILWKFSIWYLHKMMSIIGN
jgi:hypothetical protein